MIKINELMAHAAAIHAARAEAIDALPALIAASAVLTIASVCSASLMR